MKSQQSASIENYKKFSNLLIDKLHQGFVVVEQNDKYPFAVLTKEGRQVNHFLNFLLSCASLGLWIFPWFYLSYVSSKERIILIAIDEDGNPFEEKCCIS